MAMSELPTDISDGDCSGRSGAAVMPESVRLFTEEWSKVSCSVHKSGAGLSGESGTGATVISGYAPGAVETIME